MGYINFEWNAQLGSSKYDSDQESLRIHGVLVDSSVNKNGWAVDKGELEGLAKQTAGTQLRVDHGSSVRDIIGGLASGEYNSEEEKVYFDADVDDPDMIRKVMKGRVKNVSIGAEADGFCSKCGTLKAKMVKPCGCKGAHTVIKNIKLKEVSIISDPAYKNTVFSPISFTASIERALAQEVNIKNEEEEKKEMPTEEKKETVVKAEEVKKTEATTKTCPECDETKKTETKEATTLKPAGPDAVVILAEALGALVKMEQERSKKEEAFFTKMEQLMTPKQEAPPDKPETEDEKIKKLVKEAFGEVMKADEMERKKQASVVPKSEEKKEEKTVVTAGAKIDISQDQGASKTVVTASNEVPAWWAEVRQEAKNLKII